MFWKKKKISTEKFTHQSSDKRETFRLEFDRHDRFEIDFRSKQIHLSDLSASGMSFENEGFKDNDSGVVRFFFTFKNLKSPVSIKLELQIIKIDSDNICHAIYVNCSEENKEIIHKYVLEKQKERIRAQKNP